MCLALVEARRKTIEGRVDQGTASKLKSGDLLALSSSDKIVLVRITRVRRFKDFQASFNHIIKLVSHSMLLFPLRRALDVYICTYVYVA